MNHPRILHELRQPGATRERVQMIVNLATGYKLTGERLVTLAVGLIEEEADEGELSIDELHGVARSIIRDWEAQDRQKQEGERYHRLRSEWIRANPEKELERLLVDARQRRAFLAAERLTADPHRLRMLYGDTEGREDDEVEELERQLADVLQKKASSGAGTGARPLGNAARRREIQAEIAQIQAVAAALQAMGAD